MNTWLVLSFSSVLVIFITLIQQTYNNNVEILNTIELNKQHQYLAEGILEYSIQYLKDNKYKVLKSDNAIITAFKINVLNKIFNVKINYTHNYYDIIMLIHLSNGNSYRKFKYLLKFIKGQDNIKTYKLYKLK